MENRIIAVVMLTMLIVTGAQAAWTTLDMSGALNYDGFVTQNEHVTATSNGQSTAAYYGENEFNDTAGGGTYGVYGIDGTSYGFPTNGQITGADVTYQVSTAFEANNCVYGKMVAGGATTQNTDITLDTPVRVQALNFLATGYQYFSSSITQSVTLYVQYEGESTWNQLWTSGDTTGDVSLFGGTIFQGAGTAAGWTAINAGDGYVRDGTTTDYVYTGSAYPNSVWVYELSSPLDSEDGLDSTKNVSAIRVAAYSSNTYGSNDIVVFSIAGDMIPEPATMGLLAAGGVFLLRRKRR